MFMDLDLAKRLERAEGLMCTTYPSARNAYEDVGAVARVLEGTFAIFDGKDSPLTQTFGLGVVGRAEDSDLDALEAFFTERGAPTMHEVAPFAGVATMSRLVARGYKPIELSSVLAQPIGDVRDSSGLEVRVIDPAREGARWVEVVIAGWSSEPAIVPFVRTIAEVNVRNREVVHFVAERGGEAIATGSLGLGDGVAVLAGASTRPEARGLGAQGALLAARLQYAKERGCTIAMIVAEVGSTSQRNAERRGFRIAYTRTKWRRELPDRT